MKETSLSLSGFLEGNIIMDTDIVLHGLSIGRFICKDIKIYESAVVQGNIECRNAVIFGKVIGNVMASGNISLRRSANISGSLTCSELEVEEGALLNCRTYCNKSLELSNNPIDGIRKNKQRLLPKALEFLGEIGR
ncbi:MAG: polymer-forming cytoskeletal protein [Proteobacteria bacterium]|nr:polymer-forming cytoskeletal protein [Pseudomonadota bacterium]MDA0928783.1 polymer-forming cytoskeletal protein [Pseudomonadota bacterium]